MDNKGQDHSTVVKSPFLPFSLRVAKFSVSDMQCKQMD